MTLREALTTAVDFIRSSGSDEPGLRVAAKLLERKAERLRARQERGPVWEHRCYCGGRKEPAKHLCWECHAIMPAKLLMRWHLGGPKESSRALREIKRIARGREEAEPREAA